MTGGASTRKYYRVSIFENDREHSTVAMYVPEGGKPEEIHKVGHVTRWPFLEVRDLLAERGIDVPKVLVDASPDGWLLIEDLGEDTLANFLLREPSAKKGIYTRAVTDLARAQAALSSLPNESIVSTRAFDEDLLLWEIDHFREWGVEGRGITFSPEDRAAFDAIAKRLAKKISGLARGFTHRDYQSRNLMVRGDGSLVWIDFQDALLGPRVYDLVALLNDSYQEFDRAFVEERLAEYATALKLPKKEHKAVVHRVRPRDRPAQAQRCRSLRLHRQDEGQSVLLEVRDAHDPQSARRALTPARFTDADMAALDDILARTLGPEYTS